jgi:hypothetical protein
MWSALLLGRCGFEVRAEGLSEFPCEIHIIGRKEKRQAMYVQHNMDAQLCNYCCSGEAISITYSEPTFTAYDIRHAKCMRLIILSYVSCPALPYFTTLSHKRHYLSKNY